MMTRLILIFVMFVTVHSSCIDGQSNLLDINDVDEAQLDIQVQHVDGLTYDANEQPTCQKKEAEAKFPGLIKLTRGTIVVGAANDLADLGEYRLTIKKNSFLVGQLCRDGKSANLIVPDNDCHGNLTDILGVGLVEILSKPGIYDLGEFENATHVNTVTLPTLTGEIATILNGEWQASISVHVQDKMVANFAIPYNTKWLYASG